MKLVRNLSDRKGSVDTDWTINATFANNVVTVSVVVSEQTPTGENVFLNTTANFVIADLQPQFTNCSLFGMVADSNPASSWHNSKEVKVTTITKSTIVNAFATTKKSKLTIDEFTDSYQKMPYAGLIVPFADSTPDEMILMVRTPTNINVKFTSSGFSPELSPVDETTLFSLFPYLRGSPINAPIGQDTPFTVQLSKKRAGVEIYLESTGGILTNQRIVTDENGLATGYIRPISSTPFKVKAGFKNYSGIADIQVTPY